MSEATSFFETCQMLQKSLTKDDINKIQASLKSKLTSLQAQLWCLDNQKRSVLELLKRGFFMGESNSALIIGPRGSGKSKLLESTIRDFKHMGNGKNEFLEIYLNGLLQTDDRIALQEITRQLQLENVLKDKVFGSFAETLVYVFQAFKTGDKGSQPILLILEEFEQFAEHKNQTLLYNLFDVSQSAQTPLTIIGIATRLDVMELLEKRVKSRFSHQIIHTSYSFTFSEYLNIFSNALLLSDTFVIQSHIIKLWNLSIQHLRSDNAVQETLQKVYDMFKSVNSLYQLLLFVVCTLSSEKHAYIKPGEIIEAAKILYKDSKAALLHGVSVLELCLIIAMKNLHNTLNVITLNFEMIYNEYVKFIQRRAHAVQCYDKEVALKAFEHLQALEIVKLVDGTPVHIQKEYVQVFLTVDHSQIHETLQKYPSCPAEIKSWFNNPILT